MPDPRDLKIGDRVRFISIPEEWKRPGYITARMPRAFMNKMIKRKFSSRVAMIDEGGFPWISAITVERGKKNYHFWAITEQTGWRKVIPRKETRSE